MNYSEIFREYNRVASYALSASPFISQSPCCFNSCYSTRCYNSI